MAATSRAIALRGRVLYLTEDPSLLRAQLEGEDLEFDPARALLANVSTDEITPGWACFHYDETLGEFCLVGLRGGLVGQGVVRRGGFAAIVSGPSKGCGSSRETAPYSELTAGVRLVVAQSLEKIYRQNAQNIGLLTSTDMGLPARIARGEAIAIEEFTRDLDPLSAAVVQWGGLFEYNKARLSGHVSPPALDTAPRPMTLCEKILASHAVVDLRSGNLGVRAVKPGDALFARADVRFTHEYVTPMAESLFCRAFGDDARIAEPESVFAFRDHLTLLDLVTSGQRDAALVAQGRRLATVQEGFVRRTGIKLYGEVTHDGELRGSEAICHNKVIEELALPGQVVVGTDSHTCMAGALGCFAFGVGATDMANAWRTRDVRVQVPGTVRLVLHGTLRADVCAKDVMLHVLSRPFFRSGAGIGKVIEFSGDGVRALPLDERATLTNMAVEAGGFTGIIEADDVVVRYLVEQRNLSESAARRLIVRGDPGAEYVATFDVDLSSIPPMVATPGDPRNGVPLPEVGRDVKIDIAYGGSCTGGKKADIDMYARVLREALSKGRRVAAGVDFYVQFGSQEIQRYAAERGHLDVFARAGAQILGPSCGACIRAGPGASASPDQVTISAQNRNFPGRSGPGKVYLASPLVVAASAIAGRIAAPEEVLGP